MTRRFTVTGLGPTAGVILYGLMAASLLQSFIRPGTGEASIGLLSVASGQRLALGNLNPEPGSTDSGSSSLTGDRALGLFRVTFYWLVDEDAYSGERTCPLYDLQGRLLGYFPEGFMRDFRMESCAVLHDGRILSGPVAGNRCRVVTAPVGCNDLALNALHSVAVDPAVIPLGAKLYIPDADGAPLGGGARHDGFFRAQDVGGSIRGRRIDIYLGAKSNIARFTATALCCSGLTEVYLMP
jgi:3D (Asp-Asp-Asp) domain-containing protein